MLTGTVRGRWKLEDRIGKGGFGEIYISQDLKTKKYVAIKFEKIDRQKQALKLEIAVLRKLQNSIYVPRFIYCGRNLEYNYLVMELLGKNLSSLRKTRPFQRFSLATTIKLGIEMIFSIEDMHQAGFIHRDIKPSNFVLRKRRRRRTTRTNKKFQETNELSVICLIDFGLARRYRQSDGHLRPPRPKVGFRGTARYASINSHEGNELSRRDDLFSLLYLFVEFLKGELPWSQIKDKLIISKLKSKFTTVNLVKGLPKQFVSFYEHIQSLQFEDVPNYKYLRKLLTDSFIEAGYDENTKFDWELDSEHRKRDQINNGKINHQRRKKKNLKLKNYNYQQRENIKLQKMKQIKMNKKKQSNFQNNPNHNNDNEKYDDKNKLKMEDSYLSGTVVDSNQAVFSITGTKGTGTKETNTNTKKRIKKKLGKDFLAEIEKMNEIVIPSREELERRRRKKRVSKINQNINKNNNNHNQNNNNNQSNNNNANVNRKNGRAGTGVGKRNLIQEQGSMGVENEKNMHNENKKRKKKQKEGINIKYENKNIKKRKKPEEHTRNINKIQIQEEEPQPNFMESNFNHKQKEQDFFYLIEKGSRNEGYVREPDYALMIKKIEEEMEKEKEQNVQNIHKKSKRKKKKKNFPHNQNNQNGIMSIPTDREEEKKRNNKNKNNNINSNQDNNINDSDPEIIDKPCCGCNIL
ncbi:tau-tubulin kinase 1 [Anaeramoeba flamelloides]|uniref:non-specific serine/threonine protein kinase n=1 Tax=Anaeramoeba flamelloides TaxID=1746091 RepID=A0ABQ8XK52_9EUKA|nr:tau-tubulin kinase 1 [Anaeramoeba flamelloides]